MENTIGKTFGNYRITEEIGSGGMGVVYKAIHLTLDRVVAMKMIHPRLMGDSGIISRFYKEAKIQAQLNHPNIVAIYDFLEAESNYFIIMEYVHGESLEEVLQQGAFEPYIALSIFRQILDGIRYAHSKGVIHRDIKPKNFILTPTVMKITDFGIAQIIWDTGPNADEAVLGTPRYMSPEQILGRKTDHRTDIYSLGVTLYEMLTGCVPFKSDSSSDYEIKRGHVELAPPPPTQIKPHISMELENAVLKALLKEPEERFQSIDEFMTVLEKIYEGKREIINKEADPLNLSNIHLIERSNKTGGLIEGLASEEGFDEKGDLNITSYPSLLLSSYREKRTGFLVLDSQIKLKTYFLEGFIAFVEGEEPRLALAEMLVDKSKITRADKENALSLAHEAGLKIGEALIKMGKITPHELNSILETQIKEKLIAGFQCISGFYGFRNTQNFILEAIYKIHPMQIIYEGVNRFIRNGEIPQNSFYDLNSSIVPIADIKKELKDIIFSSSKELKLVELLREELTLEEATSKSPLNEESTLKFLYFLNLAELVEIRNEKLFKDKKQIEEPSDKTQVLTEQEIKKLKERRVKTPF